MATAPGKGYRKGIPRMFPDDAAEERWFVQSRWPTGVCCPHCGSLNVQTGCRHKTMRFRCCEKDCGKKFCAKSDTLMEGSKVGYQDWLITMFLISTNLKGIASMQLHRDLGITQKSA